MNATLCTHTQDKQRQESPCTGRQDAHDSHKQKQFTRSAFYPFNSGYGLLMLDSQQLQECSARVNGCNALDGYATLLDGWRPIPYSHCSVYVDFCRGVLESGYNGRTWQSLTPAVHDNTQDRDIGGREYACLTRGRISARGQKVSPFFAQETNRIRVHGKHSGAGGRRVGGVHCMPLGYCSGYMYGDVGAYSSVVQDAGRVQAWPTAARRDGAQ